MEKTEIKGFPGYFITPDGYITHGNKPLKIQINKTRNPFVQLRKDGKYHLFSIAKLVALTFLEDERKSPSDIVSFKDGNYHNFSVNNLEWTTRSNAYAKIYNGKNSYSKKRLDNFKASVCKPIASYILDEQDNIHIIKKYTSIAEAAFDVGVAAPSLMRCLKNEKNKSMGLHWLYLDKEEQNVRTD